MIGPIGKSNHKVGGASYYLLRDDEEIPEGFLEIAANFQFPVSLVKSEHMMFMQEGDVPSTVKPLESLRLVLEMKS